MREPRYDDLPKTDLFKIKKLDSMTIEVECDKSQNINSVFEFLNAHQLNVCSMRNRANRLEELFLRLTAP